MAIAKKEINDIGQGTQYHRIIAQETDVVNQQVHIAVASYTDKSYRDAEKAEETEIAETITALNAELEATQEALTANVDARAEKEQHAAELREELAAMSGVSPSDAIIKEHEELIAGLGDKEAIPPLDSAAIKAAEAQNAEIMKKLGDELEALAHVLGDLMQENYELQERMANIIASKQEYEAKQIVPRWVNVIKYTLPLSDVDMRDVAYSKLMELEPFNGGGKV